MHRHLSRTLVVVGALLCVTLNSCDRKPAFLKFYWVQPLKGHPVHQLTQLAFKDECQKLGYACEILGTDTMDTAGNVAQAEQAISRGDVAGMAIWATNSSYSSFIEKAGKHNIPVIIPHFGTADPAAFAGARGVIACDPEAYAVAAADAIGEKIGGAGTAAVTQGSYNNVENKVTAAFTAEMHRKFPDVKVLPAEVEDFDVASAVAKATAILISHPDVKGALSTTGGGALAWAGAQRDAHREIVAIAMDYTRANLDLVRDGKIYAIIAQPLWDEASGAADLLDKCVKGQQISWWTKLEAPLVTKEKVGPYYEMLDKVEAGAK